MRAFFVVLSALFVASCSSTVAPPALAPQVTADNPTADDSSTVPVMRVSGDYGGNVLAYQVYYDYLKKRGDKVQLEGVCASACTLVLGLDPNLVCATPNAVLMVHQSTTEFGTDLLLAAYPQSLKEWLNQRGGLTPDAKTIRAPQIYEFVKPCTA